MQRTINLDNKKLDALGVCFFLLLGATGVAVSLHCMQRIATDWQAVTEAHHPQQTKETQP